jgi:hypothetical protein
MSSSNSLVSAMDVVERAIADLVSTRHGQPSADDPSAPSPSTAEGPLTDAPDAGAVWLETSLPEASGEDKEAGVAEAAEADQPAWAGAPEAPLPAEKAEPDRGAEDAHGAHATVTPTSDPAAVTPPAAADAAVEPVLVSKDRVPAAGAATAGAAASSRSRSYQRQPPARSATDLSARLKARAMRAVLLALKEGHIPWDDVSGEHLRAYEAICGELAQCLKGRRADESRSF